MERTGVIELRKISEYRVSESDGSSTRGMPRAIAVAAPVPGEVKALGVTWYKFPLPSNQPTVHPKVTPELLNIAMTLEKIRALRFAGTV